jgi:hypothetical protein
VKKRKRHSESEIIKKLREAEAKLARGAGIQAVLRDLEVSEADLLQVEASVRGYAGARSPPAT